MAFTATTAIQNSTASFSFLGAQASNTIDFNRADEKVVLIARNENDTAGMTATISVAPGDFLQSPNGTLTVTLAHGNTMQTIGPLDSMRFKKTSGNVTIAVSVAGSGTLSNVKLGVINQP